MYKEVWRSRDSQLSWLWSRGQDVIARVARRTLPIPLRHWLWAKRQGIDYRLPVLWVRFGSLRRVTPLSRNYGYDRGLPIDRYYIEKFLSDHRVDIRGRVLEIGDNIYTRRFGGERVSTSDVLHVRPDSPDATIVADLTIADNISTDTYDCIILTQTLQFIFDVRAALQTLYRILKPGGVLLATFPGLSPISRYDMEQWGHFWAFTSLSAQRLFEEVFPPDHVQIKPSGNVLAATAFLYGIAAQELRRGELEYFDRDYETLIGVSAIKASRQ
jgi:SAM-dependent methyltransferase